MSLVCCLHEKIVNILLTKTYGGGHIGVSVYCAYKMIIILLYDMHKAVVCSKLNKIPRTNETQRILLRKLFF